MASRGTRKDFHPQPGMCKLLNGLEDLPLVDSTFGPVPFGSVLSYQCPLEVTGEITSHPDAPAFPYLPVKGYNFKFPVQFQPNYQQQCHLESIKVTYTISAAIEAETRQQSECQLWDWLHKPRLTASRFREICHVRGESSAKALASRILRGTPQTAAMKRVMELKTQILRKYAEQFEVSVTPCGVIVHPDAPHLGASPDAKVYSPRVTPPFGLAEVKRCDVENVSQVKHLTKVKGQTFLKKTHKFYYQVQGQLAISGLQWCDFITDTDSDFTVEKVFRDEQIIDSMRQKLDNFYFNVYMDVFLSNE